MIVSGVLAIVLTNALLCAAGIGFAAFVMRQHRRLLLLPTSVAAFLLTNGVFTGLNLWLPLEVIFPTDLLLFQRTLGVNAVVVSVAAILLIALAQMRPKSAAGVQVPPVAILALLGFSVLAVAYFVARNWAVLPLSFSLYQSADYQEYLDIRNGIGAEINSHAFSGSAPANLAFAASGPALLALLLQCRRIRGLLRTLCYVAAWALICVPAFVIGSRAMLAFAIGYPLSLLILRRTDWQQLGKRLLSFWKPGFVVILIAGYTFQRFLGYSFTEAIWGAIGRTLVIPGAVSSTYYLAFPDVFAFRGWPGVLMMPLASDVVDYGIISRSMLNIESHANAGFTAVAYSAAGFPGVALVCICVFGLAFLLDIGLLRFPADMSSLIILSNAYGILNLCSVPALIAVTTYGYGLAPAGVLAILVALRSSRRPRQVIE